MYRWFLRSFTKRNSFGCKLLFCNAIVNVAPLLMICTLITTHSIVHEICILFALALFWCGYFHSLKPRQNGRHFAVWIPIKISLNFVPKGPINNILALVQIMAWRRPGDKPLSELMMVSVATHICVARPQWVNKGTLHHPFWQMCPNKLGHM